MESRVNKFKRVWQNRWEIFTGVWNDLFGGGKITEMSRRRMDICRGCPQIDKLGTKCMVKGTQPCCGLCGCKLRWKTKVPSERCDDGRWEEENI